MKSHIQKGTDLIQSEHYVTLHRPKKPKLEIKNSTKSILIIPLYKVNHHVVLLTNWDKAVVIVILKTWF